MNLVAPKVKSLFFMYDLGKSKDFTGNITIVNKDNPSDKEVIPVSLTVSKIKLFNLFDIYHYLLYRFPFFEKILNQ